MEKVLTHRFRTDVKCWRHLTSPLVTSVGTRCEKLISTDVKCHLCSSDGVSIFEDWNLEFNIYGSYLSTNREELQQSKANTPQHNNNRHSQRVERK